MGFSRARLALIRCLFQKGVRPVAPRHPASGRLRDLERRRLPLTAPSAAPRAPLAGSHHHRLQHNEGTR